ncbi:hypothetical protein Pcinc_003621 [Petrolisthes cinctipes]|uniref:Sulfotransferase domain-containing protein n=1 Tax=Petrolisthes cinctipes TaxID=88211 RepID=A0AAE1GH05_PETCI|nr:hypothetical protein Pcinc_003621 [Petrolisthes cinctipes]
MKVTFLRYLLCLMLVAATILMIFSSYERLHGMWAAENWRLINPNVGKQEGYDETQLEKSSNTGKKPSGGNNEPATHILLVSSMGRSGSSFLGQILSSIPSAFYYFEPLYRLSHHLQEDMVWQGLKGLFTCNMSRTFLYAVVNSATCLKSGGLVKGCRSKKVKVIKSIRTQVAWVAPLLKAMPSLKVIHLVRDPRGTICSMVSLGWLKWFRFRGCDTLSQDLLDGNTLTALYPNSHYVTVYVVTTCHSSISPLMHCTAPLHLTIHALHSSTSPFIHCTHPPHHSCIALHSSTSPFMHCTHPPHHSCIALHPFTSPFMHCTHPHHHSSTALIHLTTHALHCTPPPHHSCIALIHLTTHSPN